MAVVEVSTVVSILKLLFDIYSFRREHPEQPDRGAPDPQKVQDLIKDIEKGAGRDLTDAELSHKIDKTLGPADATRVKSDLAAFEALAAPPAIFDADYWALLNKYAAALLVIARRAELFRLCGWQNKLGQRVIELPKLQQVIIPDAELPHFWERPPSTSKATVNRLECYFIDQDGGFPIALYMKVDFTRHTDMGDAYDDEEAAIYDVTVGQDVNWLMFKKTQGSPYLGNWGYRLHGTHLKLIVDAFREDIRNHLAAIERDKQLVSSVRAEVDLLVQKLGKGS